ncbi:MAG: hypothetical protein AMXMBFR26_12410 [Porticoccaceae bacterium]
MISASSTTTARHNLRQLTAIRYVLLAALALALFSLPELAELRVRKALALLLVLFAVLNAVTRHRTRLPRPISEREFFGHLLLDIGGLSLVLYLTGGASNPLVSYYLVPVSIAAATLGRRLSWTVTGLAFACYSLLLVWYRPVAALAPAGHHGDLNLHVLGMWANFAVSAGLISYFLVNMATELRRQQQHLARQREEQLRDEQLLGIATLAAGAAHELGTPLNTMKLLIDGAREEHHALTAAELDTLAAQVERCRVTLRKLVQAGDPRHGELVAHPVREYLESLVERWRVIRPDARPSIALDASSPPLRASFHPTLEPALQNLLDNAADASPRIEVKGCWNHARLELSIRDFGPGIPTARIPPRPGHSDKPDGLGLGLFLSHATIERHGGTVSLAPATGGGTLTRILLPLEEVTP